MKRKKRKVALFGKVHYAGGMRKASLPLVMVVLCLAGAAASAWWVTTHLDELGQSPLTSKTDFFFPFLTAVDNKGQSYVADTATRRVLALDKEGGLRWILEGGKREGGFYYAQRLAVDSQDRLYVYNWLPFAGADFRAEEVQIQRYTADGKLERTLYRLKNAFAADDFPVFFSFFIEGDGFFTIAGDGKTLTLSRSSLDGEGSVQVRSLPSGIDFISITGKADGTLYGIARSGSLWQALPGQEWAALDLPGLRKPWDIKVAPDGSLLVLDLLRGEVLNFVSAGPGKPVLSTAQTKGVFADTFSVAPNGALAVADKELQRLITVQPGQEPQIFAAAGLSRDRVVIRWSVWLAAGAGGLLLLSAGFIFYWVFLQRRLPLLLVQLVIFVPIIITAQAVAFNQVYDTLKKRYQEQVRDTLLSSAQLTARLLPADRISTLDQPADLDSEDYSALREVAKAIVKQGQDTKAFNFMAIYRLIDGKPCYVYTGSGTFGVGYPYTLLPGDAPKLFQQAGTRYAEYSDDYGIYDSAFASIIGPDGQPAAVVEVGQFADLIKDMENTYLAGARLFALISGGVFVLIFSLVTLFLLKSLNSLRRMTREIASGNLDLPVELKTRDEVGQLGKDFSAMSGRIKSYLNDITALTAASARFVPRDFIALLGVDDITQLRLGDQTSRDMTVMFSSVLNFRKVTGHLSAQGVFSYLNSYLASSVPLVRLNHGIVDKYIGDTYMALFPGSPADAVRSYQEINRRIQTHNSKRSHSGSERLQVSFGIHHGPLMLGIVGEAERLEGTVIADAVNLTSRLNGLCRIYGVTNVITRATVDLLEGVVFRRLDHVMVKGKTEPVLICEILDPEDDAQKPLISHLEAWESAFDLWELGELDGALKTFEFLEFKIPDDPVIRRHCQRTAQLLKEGRHTPWSPAVKLSEK